MATQYSVLLIGCGKMGSALLQGWLNARILSYAHVIEPLAPVIKSSQVAHHKSLDVYDGKPDMVVLAVKPQVMKSVCTDLARYISGSTPILSIAAGQSLANFAGYFGADQPVIRAMPNTPAAIGKGMTAAIASATVRTEQKYIAEQLLSQAGEFLWLNEEAQMDAVTAVSGSGPAYVFYLIEALSEAAIQAGLSPEQAMILARQTVIGAAALADAEPGTPADTLRRNVTSPGGTTEAALSVLMDGEFQAIMTKAVAKAAARSKRTLILIGYFFLPLLVPRPISLASAERFLA